MRLHLSTRSRRIGTAVVALSGILMLSGCGGPRARADQDGGWGRLAEPRGVTDRTHAMHELWMWSWLAAILVGVLVWGLILYACVKFRRRRDDEIPVQTRYNLPIEILYTVAPVIIVLVLFYFTITVQNHTLASAQEVGSGGKAHTVTVVAQQWSWTFNYDKDPALNGRTTVFDAGTPAHAPTLELPVNKTVRFVLRSPDVDHSFWVPAFLFKMDVIPGKDNHFSLTPTRIGTFRGRCAELCGTYHSRMLFNVKVVSESRYAAYLKKLQKQGNIGPALGGSEANQNNGSVNKVQDYDQVKGRP